jgi:hypothetical protein
MIKSSTARLSTARDINVSQSPHAVGLGRGEYIVVEDTAPADKSLALRLRDFFIHA